MKIKQLSLLALALIGPAMLVAADTPPNKLDRDGDGKVSRAEFDGTPEAFNTLDRNHDGFIDAQEAKGPGGTAPKASRVPRTEMAVPANIEVVSDIIYKTVDGQKLGIDLYRVKGRKYDKAPLVIWIHGGGYVKGGKDGAVKHNAEVMVPLLEDHGYEVVSVEYRLCSIGGPKITDCYLDCKDAVRFLVKNAAQYGIDPARMVSIGSSAGGGLALMMAYSDDTDLPGDPALAKVHAKTHAAVSWFGVTDFKKTREKFERGDEKRLVLFEPNTSDAVLDSISPVAYMHRSKQPIPTLLVHGEKDPVVPFDQSVWMKAEADRLGWPVEFMPVANMKHGFQPAPGGTITPPLDDIWKATVAFILKNNP